MFHFHLIVLYVNMPGDIYRVIAVKAYSAKYSNQLSFEKDDIFLVVNRASDYWLVGDKNGQKGIFPEECIQVICCCYIHYIGSLDV